MIHQDQQSVEKADVMKIAAVAVFAWIVLGAFSLAVGRMEFVPLGRAIIGDDIDVEWVDCMPRGCRFAPHRKLAGEPWEPYRIFPVWEATGVYAQDYFDVLLFSRLSSDGTVAPGSVVPTLLLTPWVAKQDPAAAGERLPVEPLGNSRWAMDGDLQLLSAKASCGTTRPFHGGFEDRHPAVLHWLSQHQTMNDVHRSCRATGITLGIRIRIRKAFLPIGAGRGRKLSGSGKNGVALERRSRLNVMSGRFGTTLKDAFARMKPGQRPLLRATRTTVAQDAVSESGVG